MRKIGTIFRKFALLAIPVALPCQTSANENSSGIAAGKAGISALEAGSYQRAISLFTRALSDKQLKSADRELAYLKRGEAELDLGCTTAQ